MFRVAGAFIPLRRGRRRRLSVRAARQARVAGASVRVGAVSRVAIAWIGRRADDRRASSYGVRWLPAGLWYARRRPLVVAGARLHARRSGRRLHADRRSPRSGASPATSAASCGSCSPRTSSRTPGSLDVALAYGIGVFPLGWLLVRGRQHPRRARARRRGPAARPRGRHDRAAARRCTSPPRSCSRWVTLGLLGRVAVVARRGDRSRCASPACATTVATIGLINRGARGARARSTACSISSSRARARSTQRARGRAARDRRDRARPRRARRRADRRRPRTTAGPTRPASTLADERGARSAARRAGSRSSAARCSPSDASGARRSARRSSRTLFDDQAARTLVPVTSARRAARARARPGDARRVRGKSARVPRARGRAARRGARPRAHGASRRAARGARARGRARGDRAGAAAARRRARTCTATSRSSARGCPRRAAPAISGACYPLGDERVLVAIGDVTGHGVASAMVTAAAAAACDVAVRRHGDGARAHAARRPRSMPRCAASAAASSR